MTDEQFNKVQKFIVETVPVFMSEEQIPSLSISVTFNDMILFSKSFGNRDIARNIPATADTLYGIGSITKSFIALSIMQLVEKGKIEISDPVRDYIPLRVNNHRKPITIHHLLTHSSGIPSLGTSTIIFRKGVNKIELIPWEDAKDFYRHINMADQEIVADPGLRFFYFNAGYRMLGHIIQLVNGIPFDKYIAKRVLDPLKMYRTTFSKSKYDRDQERAILYQKGKNKKLIPIQFPYPEINDDPDFGFIAASGGMISAVKELSNYLIMNCNEGSFRGIKLLGNRFIDEMQRIHINLTPNHFGNNGYGYGWRITEDFFGSKIISHGGSIPGSSAYLAFMPKHKIGVVMTSNTSYVPYIGLIQGVFAAMMGQEPNEVIPFLRIRKKINSFIGTYETYRKLLRVEIFKQKDFLFMKYKDPVADLLTSIPIPLIPEKDGLENNKFYIWSEGLKQSALFIASPDGKIDLYLDRNRFHKIPF